MQWNRRGIVAYTHDKFWGEWGVVIYSEYKNGNFEGKKIQIGRVVVPQTWKGDERDEELLKKLILLVEKEENREKLVGMCKKWMKEKGIMWGCFREGSKDYASTDAMVERRVDGKWEVRWGEFRSGMVKGGMFETQREAEEWWEKNWEKVSDLMEKRRKK
jgi:hypothetical protein